jgi:hypothetical protein
MNKEASAQVSDTTMLRRDKRPTNKSAPTPLRIWVTNKVGGLDVEKYFCKPFK